MRRFLRRWRNNGGDGRSRRGRVRIVRRVGSVVAAAIAVRMIMGVVESAKDGSGDMSIITLGVLAAGLGWIGWRLWKCGEVAGEPVIDCDVEGAAVVENPSGDCAVRVAEKDVERFIRDAMAKYLDDAASLSPHLIHGDGRTPSLRIHDATDGCGSNGVATTLDGDDEAFVGDAMLSLFGESGGTGQDCVCNDEDKPVAQSANHFHHLIRHDVTPPHLRVYDPDSADNSLSVFSPEDKQQ